MEYFNNNMVRDRSSVKKALKVLEHGSANKHKYVQAKDLVCRVAQIYISHGLKFEREYRQGEQLTQKIMLDSMSEIDKILGRGDNNE